MPEPLSCLFVQVCSKQLMNMTPWQPFCIVSDERTRRCPHAASPAKQHGPDVRQGSPEKTPCRSLLVFLPKQTSADLHDSRRTPVF